jgi:hypothetical protein
MMFSSAILYFTLTGQQPVRTRFNLTLRPIANLTYQLDVITGHLPWESSANYRLLWEEKFLSSKEDREVLAIWKKEREVKNENASESLKGFPIEPISIDSSIENSIRVAGFDAENSFEYGKSLSRIVSKQRAKLLAHVVNHFSRKFNAWWNTDALSDGIKFRNDLYSQLNQPKILHRFGQFVNFYKGKNSPFSEIPISLLFRPNRIQEPTSGQQLADHAIIQFIPGEASVQRVSVAIHEMCHYLYMSAPANLHSRLQTEFLNSKKPHSLAAYNLLNEALATAFGSGLIEPELRSPENFKRYAERRLSFYNNPMIDQGAKAIYPWLREYLDQNKTLFDPGFVEEYMNRLEEKMSSQLSAPKMLLTQAFVYVDEDLGGSMLGVIRNKFSMAGMFGSTGYLESDGELRIHNERSSLSSIFVIEPKHISTLVARKLISKEQAHLIGKKLKDKDSLSMAMRKGSKAVTYIIFARNQTAMEKELEKINSLERFEIGILP